MAQVASDCLFFIAFKISMLIIIMAAKWLPRKSDGFFFAVIEMNVFISALLLQCCCVGKYINVDVSAVLSMF